MREILFRGRTKDGKWHNGWYVKATKPMKRGFKQHEDWIVSGFSANGGWVTPLSRYAVDGDTVGQYTGFCDLNGTKIFDCDIVQNIKRTKTFVVLWDEFCGMFVLKELHDDDSDFCDYCGLELTVIGNIYDNPELLEDEQND